MRRCRRDKGVVLIFMSLAAVLFTASTAPAAGASPGNACELLTLRDVQSVLGNTFVPRQDVPLTGQLPTMSNCAYGKSDSSAKGNGVVISVQLIPYDSAQYLNMEQSGIKQQGGGMTITPVGGLGEGAFYFLGPDTAKNPEQFQLHFGKGNRLVMLSVVTGGKPDVDAAQKLGRIAYSRLR